MPAIRIEGFAGIAPKVSARLLPSAGATVARNAKLTSGELRGLHELKILEDFTSELPTVIRRAFRIPNNIGVPIPIIDTDVWVPFEDADVDFIRTPVSNDSFERYYWTGDSTVYGGVPQYNTQARILNGDPPYRLGIPTPATAPTVTPPAGSTYTRAYVYTFVSAYGEESPPSPAQLATGDLGTWVVSGLETTMADAAERNITHKRIYRTVPGLSSSEFYAVADVTLATTSYNDNSLDSDIAASTILTSTTWSGPPAGLLGLTVHPGGFLIGFVGKDLWMSEPYRPHAWPTAYVLTMETEIVGVAVYNNSIMVTTNSRPYVVQGSTPISMTPIKIDSIDPCVSRRSMAVTLEGVYYASPQGIVVMNMNGVQLRTHSLFTREEWYTRYNPAGVRAVPYGMQYIAFDQQSSGFIFSPADSNAPLSEMDRFDSIDMIQIDQYSGDVYVLRHNQVCLWDPIDTIPYYYTWQSKEFDFPLPVNFGAMRVKFKNLGEDTLDEEAIELYRTFNQARIAEPLGPLGMVVLGGVRRMDIPGWVEAQNRNPLGGSPLYPIVIAQSVEYAVQIRLWARLPGSSRELVYTQTVTDEGVYRLPEGFKSETWQVELVGNTDVYSIALADTPKALRAA